LEPAHDRTREHGMRHFAQFSGNPFHRIGLLLGEERSGAQDGSLEALGCGWEGT